MMNSEFTLTSQSLSQLLVNSGEVINSRVSGAKCSINIIIPSHQKRLEVFYQAGVLTNIDIAQQDSGISYKIHHFGLQICFEEPTELFLHDLEMNLLPSIKNLIKRFSVIIIKNAYLKDDIRDIGHRGKFPHLKFHYDRTEKQPTVYSLYSRNPFDDEQKFPRNSSTLFAPNLVAYLQSLKEKNYSRTNKKSVFSNYDIFHNENMNDVISKVIIEHRWDEPEGVGELSMIDNRTVLHASYHREGFHPGYRIGVRYCS